MRFASDEEFLAWLEYVLDLRSELLDKLKDS